MNIIPNCCSAPPARTAAVLQRLIIHDVQTSTGRFILNNKHEILNTDQKDKEISDPDRETTLDTDSV